MAKSFIGAAGGLSAADKALLVPENIRSGVTIGKVTGGLLPSCKENSLVCSWAKVYDNGEKPAVVGNITVDSPISVSDTGITVKRAFSAFVMKFPYSLHDTAQGSSSIPEGQVNFTEGQSFSVSVNPVHGYSRTSGIVILLAVNG